MSESVDGLRPVATVAGVFAIAAKIRPWYRALVLVAAFTSLRWGELIAWASGPYLARRPPHRERCSAQSPMSGRRRTGTEAAAHGRLGEDA